MPEESPANGPPANKPRKLLRRAVLVAVAVLLVAVVARALVPGRTPAANPTLEPGRHEVVAVFGGSGRVGDGILEAVLADPGVTNVFAITRRVTPRMEEGARAGKLHAVEHMNYLDYGALEVILPQLDAVYWALGTAASKVDDAAYSEIHVDFPLAFVAAWLAHAGEGDLSFHLVSGQGASPDGWQHWAREKARAERELSALVDGTNIRVVSYRPTYVIPSRARAEGYHEILLAILHPLALATRSTDIGRAMLEVTARGAGELPGGTILENADLLEYAAAYSGRD